MKKWFTVLISLLLVMTVFVACSKGNETTEKVTAPTAATTGEAMIKDEEAINLIKSYSAKELGLSDEEMKECSFMVATGGVKIEDAYYIEVIATVKQEHKEGEEVSYTFDNKGEYYIRYDGKEILSKDTETGKYSKLKVKNATATAEKEEHSETTTKKN